MGKYELINLQDFIDTMSGERHRTFIVHGQPLSGKSEYARRLVERMGGVYVDLLSTFADDQRLNNEIDVFGIEELEEMLVEKASGADLLILDNIEFLLNTWGEPEHGYGELLHFMSKIWDSFKSRYMAVLGVFLITNRQVEEFELQTLKGDPRIIHFNRLENIGESVKP